MIAIPALGYFRFRMNPILAFWFAYVVTRPLGASFADWLGKPSEAAASASATASSAWSSAAAIAGFVAYLGATGKDTPAEARAPRPRERSRHAPAIADGDLAPEET